MKFLKLFLAYFNPGVVDSTDWNDIDHKYLKSVAYIFIGIAGIFVLSMLDNVDGNLYIFSIFMLFSTLIIFGVVLIVSVINDFLNRHINMYVKKAMLYFIIGVPLFYALIGGFNT